MDNPEFCSQVRNQEFYTEVSFDILLQLLAYGPISEVIDLLNMPEEEEALYWEDSGKPFMVVKMETGEVLSCYGTEEKHHDENSEVVNFPQRNFLLPEDYNEVYLESNAERLLKGEISFLNMELGTDSWVDERFLTWKLEEESFLENFNYDEFIRLKSIDGIKGRKQVYETLLKFEAIYAYHDEKEKKERIEKGAKQQAKDKAELSKEAKVAFLEESQRKNHGPNTRRPSLDQLDGERDAW